MSGNSPSVVNLGDLTKPATVLVERIADALGGAFKPWQVRREARAQADADIIRATADLHISELQKRALARFVAEETRKQRNIESIGEMALPHVKEDAPTDTVQEDWLVSFLDRSKLVSDVEMQALWARILAGEANCPGSFSRRTVNDLGSLDRHDAEMFRRLCRFVWRIGNELVPVILDYKGQPLYSDRGINFDALRHLDEIGLVNFSTFGTFAVSDEAPASSGGVSCEYFSDPVTLISNREPPDEAVDVGFVLLTRTGMELAPIAAAEPIDGFLIHALTKWVRDGWVASSQWPRK